MKALTDLRPCDNCGGPLGLVFHVVRASLAVVNVQVVNEFLGMHQFFGGKASAALVENFAPATATAVRVAGDEAPSLMTEFLICPGCFLTKPLDMALLTSNAHQRTNEEIPHADV